MVQPLGRFRLTVTESWVPGCDAVLEGAAETVIGAGGVTVEGWGSGLAACGGLTVRGTDTCGG